MKWTDSLDVAIALSEAHPEVDPTRINFVDLMTWVMDLPGFEESESHCGEKKLEAIQQAWIDELDQSVLVDTHCHLDAAEFDPDREAVAAAATQAGVGLIVVPAVERANFGAVASVCREHAGCGAAYGIHPMYVQRAREADLDALRETVLREHPLAVGEIGLDHFVESRDEAQQELYFTAQLQIARDNHLPVLLHVRRAIDPVLKALRRCRVPGGIAHAFNGSRQQADEFIKLGFKLGFGGAMTFPRAKRIRELAATLPLESIVLETDAPDIPPEWKVGARNTPDQLPRIALALAGLRGIAVEEVVEATTRNATAVLPGLSRMH